MRDRQETELPEPWLRGSFHSLPLVLRAVLHALELAKEDIDVWCGELTDEQLNARPYGMEPASFHLRHLARSLDRLLTYAEGQQLSPDQIAALRTELAPGATREDVLGEWNAAFHSATNRLHGLGGRELSDSRSVGKKQLQTTLGGLLIHIAEHTQRHAGQLITTAKVLRGSSSEA